MKKRTKLIVLIIILALAVVAALFALNGRGDKTKKIDVDDIDEAIEEIDEATEEGEIAEYGNGIDFDEEADDAELSFSKTDVANYYGTWKATSDQAMYLYGKLELTINEDNTWSGIVVDEKESGKWSYDGTRMELTSEFFNVSLSFTDDGTLVMQEDREEDGEYINTVLTKVQ